MNCFDICVQLVTNIRAKGASPQQALFRAFQMECLRPCAPTEAWHKYLEQTSLAHLPAREQQLWQRKFRLCSTNEARNRHNVNMLAWTSRMLQEPIATIQAEHPRGGRTARAGTSKQAQGLLDVLSICVGAWVTFNWNGWVSRGICNGLMGVVLEIVYKEGEAPPSLPLVVFVACSKYRGESYDTQYDVAPPEREQEILEFAGFRAGQPGVVAVQPISRKWTVGKLFCERKQLPLDVAWAVSSPCCCVDSNHSRNLVRCWSDMHLCVCAVHKSQGMTIGEGKDVPEALLDLGPTELDLGLAYTGVGRFMSIANLKTIFPTWSRFENIGSKNVSDGKHATLLARDAEARRISSLAAATKTRFTDLWQRCVEWSCQ
jgi:hypothetical protein